jgi:GNAT superfamily N-acetyltransferase
LGPSFAPLHLKTGYLGERPAFLALVDLLRDIFDIDIGRLDGFGGPDLAAMPFGYFDPEGRCVANFTAFPMPLMIEGRIVRAVGYQSGAVRPDYRGRGLYRDLMGRAFAWAQLEGFELGLLLTDKPALYRPYGFEVVAQHVFRGLAPQPSTPQPPAWRLSLTSSDDIALVRRLLAERQPVSNHFSIAGHQTEFLLNACFDDDIRLSHLPGSDAIAAWRVEEDALHLLDIVAARVPPLADIAGALQQVSSQCVVHFPPDRLDWPLGRPESHTGFCDLMVAPMAETHLPAITFALPPMAEF